MVLKVRANAQIADQFVRALIDCVGVFQEHVDWQEHVVVTEAQEDRKQSMSA
jgi:hypothetical protein